MCIQDCIHTHLHAYTHTHIHSYLLYEMSLVHEIILLKCNNYNTRTIRGIYQPFFFLFLYHIYIHIGTIAVRSNITIPKTIPAITIMNKSASLVIIITDLRTLTLEKNLEILHSLHND